METHGHLPCRLRTLDHRNDLIERHVRRVVDLRLLLAEIEKGGVHERAGIDNDIRLSQIACALHRDELRVTGTRTDNMNHEFLTISLP